MPFEDVRLGHRVVMEERNTLSVSGVEEVESFDENVIVMTTSLGTLVVRGEGLHIEALSLEGGDLTVEGEVESLTSEETQRREGGLLARLLR